MAAPNPPDPNLKMDTMCPLRSGVDLFATPGPLDPSRVQVQTVPKRAPCMRDCAIFDKAKDQCMAKTAIEKLLNINLGGLGALFGGGP